MKGVGTLLHAGSAVLTIPRPNIKDRCRKIKFPFPTSLTHCLVCVAVGNENDRELKNRYSLYPRLHHLFGTFIGEQTNTWAAVTVKKLEPIKINGTNACLTTPYLLWFFRELESKTWRTKLSVKISRCAVARLSLYVFAVGFTIPSAFFCIHETTRRVRTISTAISDSGRIRNPCRR